MKERRKITITYQCMACVRSDLIPKGYSCKFSVDTEEDSQGYCISKCPIFGEKLCVKSDKVIPKWNVVSVVKHKLPKKSKKISTEKKNDLVDTWLNFFEKNKEKKE